MPSVEQIAWIQSPDMLYFARCRKSAQAPTSATIKLLQGIFDLYRDHSFFILRNKIFLNYPPEQQDIGMIKLLAKRHEISAKTPDFTGATEIGASDELYYRIQSRRYLIHHEPGSHITVRALAETLARMEDQIPLTPILHKSPRRIVAFALDGAERLLAATAHSGVVNKSLHAEVCLIQDLHRMGLVHFPDAGTLVVSMKPCRMCAAMIADFLPENFRGQILYREENEGSRTRGSVLDGKAYFKNIEKASFPSFY